MFGVRIFLKSETLILNKNVKFKQKKRYSSVSSVNSKDDNKNSTSYQSISDFYSGKSVFVTGGTGFLGKSYLEKLLYSCTKLDKVYILVRDKKGENVNERIKNIFENPLFTRLKQSQPDYLKKVVPIAGDVTLPNLGLSSKDEQTLIDKVSVVYHGAATVKFNDPLAVTMKINYEGTQQMLSLSQKIKNLEAFVYVSTAYAHTQHKVLAETVYPSPAKIEDVYKFIHEYGNDYEATMNFIKGKPNIYTFTKSLTEAYIASNHGHIPTVIVRPSIVTAAKDEPVKGWLDNWYGIIAIMFIGGKGWSRFAPGNDHPIDCIPVDYVTNISIVAGARAKESKQIQVFNITSSSENPVTLTDFYKYFNEAMVSRNKNEVPYPRVFLTKSKAILKIGTFIFQTTPAHVADLWLRMTGREPKYGNLMFQVVGVRDAYDFFTRNTWIMKAEKTRQLYSALSPEDQKTFPFDPTQIEWQDTIRDFCNGALKYLKPRYSLK